MKKLVSNDDLVREKTLRIDIKDLPTEPRVNPAAKDHVEQNQPPAAVEEDKDNQELKEKEQKLIDEINILAKEVEEEENDSSDSDSSSEYEPSEADSHSISHHFDIEATEEDKQEDRELQAQLVSREKEVDSLESALNQKQELLNAIIESNKEMKKTIVDTLKQEYLKKIIALQGEIKKLESQKENDLK